ncbi:MAG: hypothetical protein HYZ42_17855 [Bacteroidetes bacterium]|nr:hypothetical protein [Bacteroidota bacterium]
MIKAVQNAPLQYEVNAFFKCYKQEAYLMEALNKGDVNGIEQNKNALAKVAIEGLTKLSSIAPYEDDLNVVNACKQLLMFYKEEAETKMNDISKFFVSKENFSKIKVAFDGKPAKQRQKEDVDAFNNAVTDYNTATNNFNAPNIELNTNRAKYIDEWNNTCSKFTDKHVPKG